MKILIVSWYFPPCSTMGALRVGKFAKYLVGEGHDVKIVCAGDQPYARDHPVEVPEDIVHYTKTRDINWLPAKVQALRVALRNRRAGAGGETTADNAAAQSPAVPPADPPATGESGGLLRRALNFYRLLTNIPDGIVGWLFPALAAARQATRDWTPDVVFASAPPFTTLIAGRIVAKRTGAPLVIEYRDRWIEDPYGEQDPAFRRWIDRRLEEWCARPAKAVVTVSEPWAADYRARWGKPVAVCYNGYDPDDAAAFEDVQPRVGGPVGILYTGIIYPDRRDPAPLLDALALLGEDRKKFTVNFYGPNVDRLAPAVAEKGQADIVSLHDSIPFREALRLQRAADVLLLLQWNNPLEAGNVPGKVFEYLAARRPVLGIGYEQGVPAGLLAERGAGKVLNDPAAIAAFLREILARRTESGVVSLLPESVCAGLSRPEQYGGVVEVLRRVARGSSAGA